MKAVFAATRMLLLLLLLFALFGLGFIRVDAQTVPALDKINSQPELDAAITALDAALFDAYNRCDLDKFSSFFVDDVEFYHDQGGVTLCKANLTDSVKKNICGKNHARACSGNTAGSLHERLWRRRNGCPPLSSPWK